LLGWCCFNCLLLADCKKFQRVLLHSRVAAVGRTCDEQEENHDACQSPVAEACFTPCL
jgi:hypothetical protein